MVRYTCGDLLAKLAVTTAAALGILAADAMGASLVVTVTPASVHPGKRYAVTIAGRYDRAARPRPPYLLAFVQYTGRPCKATATAEYALPTSQWSWDFYPQQAETRSPFKNVVYWKAGAQGGARRVCAYLYAQPVSPVTTAPPLARAGASFRNTKR